MNTPHDPNDERVDPEIDGPTEAEPTETAPTQSEPALDDVASFAADEPAEEPFADTSDVSDFEPVPQGADTDIVEPAELPDTLFDAPSTAPLGPFLDPDTPFAIPVPGPLVAGLLENLLLPQVPLPLVPLSGVFESFSVDASAAQFAILFAPANSVGVQDPAETGFRSTDAQALLRTDRASIDATPSIVLPPLGGDPSGAAPRVFEGAPLLGTPPPPPDFLNGGSSSLGMMRPQVTVSLDKRVDLVHAALDAQSDRMEAIVKRIAKQEIDYHDWVLYTEERAIHGDY